jgi:hypothetical protein
MSTHTAEFYICPTCFNVKETPGTCHEHPMIHCQEMAIADKRRRPEMDEEGRLQSDAPRWFLQARYHSAGKRYLCDFYICPVCFNVSETETTCHQHTMIHCGRMSFDDIRRRPHIDDEGNLKSQAPIWFLEAVARLQQQDQDDKETS